MDCRCDTVTELYATEAEEYASSHLHAEQTDDERLEQAFSCRDTGRRWLLDYPERTERDPGAARLRLA